MIPLTIPHFEGNEWKYVKDCLDTGWVSMAGAYVEKFERKVADFAGAKYGVATVNGTSALHIALKLAGVKENDLVIAPNLTFIASINAIKYMKADPILVDIDPNTWQMDLDLLERFLERSVCFIHDEPHLINSKRRIKAIMPVHVLGNMCDMEHLQVIADKYNLAVIEDSAEALGSYYKDQHSGTFGIMGCFSFNGNKIITTGGGGVIVTNNEKLAQNAKHLTTQAKVSPDEYIHDEIGYNYRLVNILAALGLAQMEQLPMFIQKKKMVDSHYRDSLSQVGEISFQEVTGDVSFNAWLVTIKCEQKDQLLTYLKSCGIMCRPFWMPMNRLAMFKDDLYISKMDNSGSVYESCISIPCSVGISENELNNVVSSIKQFYK